LLEKVENEGSENEVRLKCLDLICSWVVVSLERSFKLTFVMWEDLYRCVLRRICYIFGWLDGISVMAFIFSYWYLLGGQDKSRL